MQHLIYHTTDPSDDFYTLRRRVAEQEQEITDLTFDGVYQGVRIAELENSLSVNQFVEEFKETRRIGRRNARIMFDRYGDHHKTRMVRMSVAIMMCLYSAAIGVLIAIGAFAAGGAW